MDKFPKFIVETIDEYGICLILSKCTYHNELVTDKTKVRGGGWFKFDSNESSFTFFADSHEFGAANIEDIRKCIANGNVYTNKFLTHSIANKHKFYYDNNGEIIKLQ